MMSPLLILIIGMFTVIGMILVLRLNAFLSLTTAALVVSLLAPGDLGDKVGRVAVAFGSTAGSIGIVIALAAVIGMCMLESRAADRIVQAFIGLFGMRRADAALLGSGYLLSIPVFFDTVFYLLIPLARSLRSRSGGHYAKYVMVICAGAVLTHSLVPPTPGPLINARNLGVDIGTMMLVGLIVSVPAAAAGLAFAAAIDRRIDIPYRDDDDINTDSRLPHAMPGLAAAITPIVLPVLMITSNTIASALAPDSKLAAWTAVLGNANTAMLAAAAIALILYVKQARPNRVEFSGRVEKALMSGGLIILITSAGGAFGAMLAAAEVGPSVQRLLVTANAGGIALLFSGFMAASLLKIAQGSSTVAMITTSAMFGPLVVGDLAFHPVYLAMAIGSGAMVGSWMNDSGFWIVSKMGGLTEAETFRTWSTIAAAIGVTAFVCTLVLFTVAPLR